MLDFCLIVIFIKYGVAIAIFNLKRLLYEQNRGSFKRIQNKKMILSKLFELTETLLTKKDVSS